MPPVTAEVRRWLEKAEHDRRTAETTLADVPPITDVAAFHCQQTVEKLLKAYLLYRGQPFERTHDLAELVALCVEHDEDFAAWADTVGGLTPYAVRFRCPGPADPTAPEVQRAFGVVNDVWNFVLSRLPTEVHP